MVVLNESNVALLVQVVISPSFTPCAAAISAWYEQKALVWSCWKGELVSELIALAGFQLDQFSSLILHKQQRSDGVGKESCPGAGESDFHFMEKEVMLA